MPCNIMAAGTVTPGTASRMPMRIIPPAIPRMPEMNDVTSALTARIAMKSAAGISAHRAFRAQPRDGRGVVPEARQDLVRVLAEEGCRPFHARWRVGEFHREAQRLHASGLRVVDSHHHLA